MAFRADHGSRRRARRLARMAMVGALALLAAPLPAQSLAQRVRAVRGAAEVRFAAREGVCGDGEGSINFRSRTGSGSIDFSSVDDTWRLRCRPGPVRVVLTVGDGGVERIHTYVGESRRAPRSGVAALGTVSAREAADFFLGLARSAEGRVAEDAVLPAALADSVTMWPDLLRLAQERSRPVGVRKRALFWAGQIGEGETVAPVRALMESPAEDRTLRAHAAFVLSQLPDGEGVPALIAAARSPREPWLARKATFWLGQTEDDRARAALRELVLAPGTPEEVKREAVFVIGQRDDPDGQAFLREHFTRFPDALKTRVLMGVAQHGGAEGARWLLGIVGDSSQSTEVRKKALFWAGQGSEIPTSQLAALEARLQPRALREHLLFVLSQRDDSAAVDALMQIAEHDPDRGMRRKAMFWLGQKDDPRVVAFLTRILER